MIDEKTKEPLIGVNVIVKYTQRGAATDFDGRFQINNLPVGTYQLEFSYLGYVTRVITEVVVNNARPANVNVELQPSALELRELQVTADYFDQASDKPISNITLSREEIRRFPGGFEDVVRTAATLPGVAVVNEGGRNDLLVRGGGPSENLFLINNIQVPNLNHFGNQGTSSGALSFVNLDFVEAVEFSTGGFGVRYGDKMSSVLALRLRPGRADRFGGKATISATQYGLNLEGPFARSGNFLFSARQSYLDLIFRASGLAFIPIYTDFNLLANFDLSPNGQLTVLGLTAINRVDRDLGTAENRVQNASIMDNTQNQFITGLNYRRLLDRGFVDLTLNGNYNQYRFSQADEFQDEYFNSRANEVELGGKLNAYYQIADHTGLYGGLALKQIRNDNTTVFADTIYDRSGNRIALAQSEYRPLSSGAFLCVGGESGESQPQGAAQ